LTKEIVIVHNSGIARTIFLQGKADGNQTNYLSWWGYGNQFSSVNEYNISRQDINGSFNVIVVVDNQTFQFIDDVQDVETNENGQICYKIEAGVTVAYPMLSREQVISSSNIVCLNQDTMVNIITSNSTVEKFEIHPNPATNIINLILPVYQNYTVKIIQLNGTLIEEYDFAGIELQLKTLNLSKGIYLVKANGQTDNKQYYSKLIWLGD